MRKTNLAAALITVLSLITTNVMYSATTSTASITKGNSYAEPPYNEDVLKVILNYLQNDLAKQGLKASDYKVISQNSNGEVTIELSTESDKKINRESLGDAWKIVNTRPLSKLTI